MKNWSIEKQVLAGFGFALAVLAITGLLAYRSTLGFIETTAAAARSQQALTALESIFSLMSQAEAQQRAYLILGEESALAPRAEAVARIGRLVADLKAALADDPAQAGRIPELERRIADRLRLLDLVLAARRARGFEAARRQLETGPGRREMNALREHIERMTVEESARLERLRAAARQNADRTLIAYGLLLATSLVFLSLVYVRILREARERRRAQQALAEQAERLRESEARMHAILDTAADAIIVIDEHGLVDRFNPAAERMFGYARDEVTGRNVSMLMPPPYREEHDGYLERYRRTGERRIIGIGREVVARRKDGTTFPIELGVSEVRLRERRLFTGVVRDITERRHKQEELARLVHELESANEELKSFAYVVSHDLKAPLRAIGSLADWLAADYGDRLDDEGKEHLRLLINRARRMDGLIDGILQYSRVGRVKEAVVPVDLNQMLRDVIDLLAPPAHVAIAVDGPLPTLLIEKTRIQQVFQNLLANAIKYLDKPEGRIRVSCATEGGMWRFGVADNGPGIESRHHEKIFHLFQTLAPRDRVEGAGVGLALVKKIVELYGGRVWLESAPGRGSTFFFTLPRTTAGTKAASGDAR